MIKKTSLLFFVALFVFSIVFSVLQPRTATAFHAANRGYFYDQSEGGGWWNVWPSWGGRAGCQGDGWALPGWVDTTGEFINFVKCKLGGNTRERIGAAFMMSQMAGFVSTNPNAGQVAEWEARVNHASNMGWINFGAWLGCNPSSPPQNTFYQSTRQDVAWYWGCPVDNSGNIMYSYSAITIYNGSSHYVIARLCANPLGSGFGWMPPLADDINFNMNGSSSVNDTTVDAGQNINFTHSLTNAGPTGTSPTTINWTTQSASSPGGPWSNVSSGNAGTFSSGQTKNNIGNQTVTVPNSPPGTQICRRITWSPDTHTGGSGSSGAACATIQYNYNLTPTINAVITGVGGPITGNIAEPGDTIRFTYAVNNTGATVSQNVTCTYNQATHSGYSEAPPTTLFTPSGANCPPVRTFPAGANTTTAVEASVSASPANSSICRSFTITPVTVSGGSRTVQSCVHVAAKPYAKVYGGDVLVGGAVETAPGVCDSDDEASVIGWNLRSGAGFAGSGTQFAVVALNKIFDSASTLGSAAGASPPSSLSFGNTSTAPGNGDFGGGYGSSPCFTDYYASLPSGSPSVPGSVSAMSDGAYSGTGDLVLGGGIVSPGEQISVYVDGNVLIGGNITYGDSGNWNSTNIPMFRLIVRGNIFIDNDVSQLDGLYVAQARSDGSQGVIYTCGTMAAMFTPLDLDDQLASECDNQQLRVNGGLAARQLRLMRTVGTLRASSASELPSNTNIAEIINYTPALWVSQPWPSVEYTGQYDSITSLPPIL